MKDYNDDYFYEDMYEDENIYCHLCGCVIGDEVGYGYELAPGEHVCDVCAGDYD